MRGLLRVSENGSGRRARRSLAACLFCVAALSFAVAATPAQAITKTFNFTEGEQTFVVPAGVYSVHVVAVGGRGGSETSAVGGQAGEAIGDIAVTPNQTLYVEVGGDGESLGEGGEGGFNGGGNGGGGGGGASDVRTEPASALLSLESRLIVAGGGGGAGSSGPSGVGGNGGAAGEDGGTSESYAGGGKGTLGEGGKGAEGCEPAGTGTDGIFGEGGDGGYSGVESGPGGGGGGGYYGGGGGGGACIVGSSGGGGGSSLVPLGGIEGHTSDAAFVQISYNPPPTVTITNPVNGATFTQGQAVKADYSCTPGLGTTLKTCSGPVANGALLDTATLGNHSFTVEAEDNDKGTGSKTVVYAVVAPGQEQKTNPPPLPNTILGSHPKRTIKTSKKKVKVKFGFSSDVAGATFECKLDKGAYTSCVSPKTYKVKLGSHVFSVRAKSAGGVDPTPATFRFKVKKKA